MQEKKIQEKKIPQFMRKSISIEKSSGFLCLPAQSRIYGCRLVI
jgi:hypothetical protein